MVIHLHMEISLLPASWEADRSQARQTRRAREADIGDASVLVKLDGFDKTTAPGAGPLLDFLGGEDKHLELTLKSARNWSKMDFRFRDKQQSFNISSMHALPRFYGGGGLKRPRGI